MDMEMQKLFKKIEEQQELVTTNAQNTYALMRAFVEKLKSISEIACINEYIIGHILNEKFNMSTEEINHLVSDAKDKCRKAIEEIKEIEKMFDPEKYKDTQGGEFI